MSKPVILTGLRANNDFHIGNYFGAVKPIVDMAKNKSSEYQINLFIPDLHSITTEIDYKKLQHQIKQNIRVLVAAGFPLDNDNVFIYRQSYIPAHSELTLILNSFARYGELYKMTQFKQKANIEITLQLEQIYDLLEPIASGKTDSLSSPDAHSIIRAMQDRNEFITASVALFDYPVLMAADILLYNAEYIPVGDDQSQHLEFTRDIAQRMNSRFGEIFTLPKQVNDQHKFFQKDQGLRIKDLSDPSKKMSKSTESDKGVIFLNENVESAKKKIMSATTDSLNKVVYDPKNQPGISNLLEIYALIKEVDIRSAENEFRGETSYGNFKSQVAEAVGSFIDDFNNRLDVINQEEIENKLISSEQILCLQANKTLLRAQKAVGLR